MATRTAAGRGDTPTARAGRPTREGARLIGDRILDAAEALFLAEGFEGAAMERVAAAAGVGKRTLYSRHPGKEALFTAVVERSIGRVLGGLPRDGDLPGDTVDERLTHLCATLLDRSLTPGVAGLMRAVIAASGRFPDLARLLDEHARARIVGFVAGALAREVARGAVRPHDGPAAAEVLVGCVFLAPLMRPLMGHGLDEVRREVPGHVARAVALFLDGVGRP